MGWLFIIADELIYNQSINGNLSLNWLRSPCPL